MWTLVIIVLAASGPPVFVTVPGFASPVPCNDAGRKIVREYVEFGEKTKLAGRDFITFTCVNHKGT